MGKAFGFFLQKEIEELTPPDEQNIICLIAFKHKSQKTLRFS